MSTNAMLDRALSAIRRHRIRKGNKPMGAAFSHARRLQNQNGGDHEDNVRRANQWLKENGHAPIGSGKDESVSKGLLSRFRALSLDERADMGILLEQGFEPHEARALAMAGTGRKVSKAAMSYAEAYVEQAKKHLPLDVHDNLHKVARARAGGFARADAARAQSIGDDAADNPTWREQLAAQARSLDASEGRQASEDVGKGGPSIMEVQNFGAPSLPPKRRKAKVQASDSQTPPQGVRDACKRGLELAPKYGGQGLTEGAKARARSMAAGEAQTPSQLRRMKAFFSRHQSDKKDGWSSPPTPGYVAWQLWGGDAGASWASAKADVDKSDRQPVQKRGAADPIDAMRDAILSRVLKDAVGQPQPQNNVAMQTDELGRLLAAQELVARMDDILADGSITVDQARSRASDQMAHRADNAPGAQNGAGLRLDLDAGNDRLPGYLSLDLYPYDHGTVLQDIALGLGVPTDSTDAIRAIIDPSRRPQLAQDPSALFAEAQRVLRMGGTMHYTGPFLPREILQRTPGLALKDADIADDGTQTWRLERRAAQLPTVYGADPAMMGERETAPGDIEAAAARFGTTPPPAATAMAHLLSKSDANVCMDARVLKKDTWEQIVYGVVLAPNEEDSQGDVISAEEIQQTAHRYLESRIVGDEHTGPMESATVVESYIAPQDLAFAAPGQLPQQVPMGSWVLGVHIKDDDLWAKVLSDEFTGFSVGGYGDRTPLS